MRSTASKLRLLFVVLMVYVGLRMTGFFAVVEWLSSYETATTMTSSPTWASSDFAALLLRNEISR